MKKRSEFGKLNSIDLLNALYYFLGTMLLSASGLIAAGILPTKSQVIALAGAALSAGLTNIFKNFVTNKEGKVFKKEK